jgi:UDP-N-acetylmuramyl pentapeptide phosphotransferase/UDP-N-acetylglucosamine-1-phosphate transferase
MMKMENGNKIDSAGRFAELKSRESGEAAVFAVLHDKTRIPVRVCVKRKEKEAFGQSRKRLEHRASRKGGKLQEKTVVFNEFIAAVISLTNSVSADEVL